MTYERARDARPPQRVGPSRRLRSSGPNPGASRRLCPGRYARALRVSSSRTTLDQMKPGENRWNCVASIPAS